MWTVEAADTYGETGTTGWEGSSDRETESRQEEAAGTENRANAANTEVMNQADTGGSVRTKIRYRQEVWIRWIRTDMDRQIP